MKNTKKFEFGISTFVETTRDPITGVLISHEERIRQIIEEIVLADQVGLDFYGVGEHHRPDFAASAPAIILAGAATVTKQITLGSAVTVLSSDDPVRVYQDFATIDALSHGRSELMAGRGSFTESFPLFGYDLDQYNILFTEKLDLLLKIRDNEVVSWQGKTRAPIDEIGIYPRTSKPIQISIAVGGTTQSVIRAAKLGLPIVFAIIGGNPLAFNQLIQLYKHVATESGHDLDKLKISVHSHGFIMEDGQQAADVFYPYAHFYLNKLGKERGWAPYTKDSYEAAKSKHGALFVGSPEEVAEKIVLMRKNLGIDRFIIHTPIATMNHDLVMNSIRLFGTRVVPLVRKAIED